MDDRLLEQIGHFIGQTRAEVLTITDDNLEKAVEAVREDIVRRKDELLIEVGKIADKSYDDVTDRLHDLTTKHGEEISILTMTDQRLDKAIESVREDVLHRQEEMLIEAGKVADQSFDDFNDKLNDLTTKHVQEIATLTEHIKAQEIFEAQLTERIAQIKDGEEGAQGAQGNDGEDGLDRPILEPVELVAQKDYPKSTVGTFDGGLWIATKETVGSPEDDPQAWHCMLDAMTTMSIDLMDDRRFKLSVRMSSGQLIDDTFDIPFPDHKGIWEEGDYKKGDIVTKGSSMWLAQEDTSGAPPGNGWQQILSAPRGKQGPAGKSIVGPQGKPGRNGADAILPKNFIEDVMTLAGERKAFEDGRSGAEAIVSFRGYFMPDEKYGSGDVVNHDGGLYLCVVGGRFNSIANSQASWELMLGVPKVAFVNYMHWQGKYVAKTYNSGMVVGDGPWTMVANKQTNDAAGPYPVGDPSYLAAGATYAPLVDTVKNVVFGTRIKQSQSAAFIRGYKIDVIATFDYRIFYVQDPLTTPIVVELANFTAASTETLSVNLGRIPIGAGRSFDIVAVITEPDPSPTQWTGDWEYDTPPSNGIPLNAHVLQANENPASLRVSVIDNNAGDRTAELAALSPGDTITDGASLWTITNSVDNGTWFDFTVSPNQQSPTDGLRTFTFNTTIATAITIGSDTDYWLGNANVRGILGVDGGYADVVEDDNAYSIDIQVQDAYVSPDWEVVAYSPDLGSAPEAVPVSELTVMETSWVRESASSFDTGTIQTAGATWTEVDRRELTEAVRGKIVADAKRLDQIEYHSSEWSFLAYNDGIQLVSYLQKDIEIGADLSFRLVEDGNDIVFEVRGKPSQTWKWDTTAFYRGIE